MFDDFFDSFGAAELRTKPNGDIIIAGINTDNLLGDMDTIWKNAKIAKNMFKEIRKHRIVFDPFFLPDVRYVLTQIIEFKNRRMNKYRVRSVINQIDTKTWMSSLNEQQEDILDFSQLKNLKHTLFEHQVNTLKVYNTKVPQMHLKGFLLSTPPGSGKTIMSIALSQCLRADVSFYVVPKNTVTTVWYDGILDELPKARVWASTHGVPITEDYDHYVFHFEALPLAIYIAKKLAMSRRKSFIAIDEAHNLNEISSIRALRLIELAKVSNCQNTVFASGTPIKALGIETIPLLRCIDPFFTPEVENRFKAIYGMTAKRATDILRNRLGMISHKIPEESYMKIPKPIEIDLKIKIPDARKYLLANIKAEMKDFMKTRHQFYQNNMRQYIQTFNKAIEAYERTLRTSQDRVDLATYKKYVEIIIKGYDPKEHKKESEFCKQFEKTKILPALQPQLRNQFKDAISIVKYAKLRVLGECLAIVGRRRSECACDLARYGNLDKIVTDADKKTIIFSSYIEALEVGYKYFTDRGFNALRIFGDFTKELAPLVKKFKSEPDINPLLGTLQSLSASQTLTNANVVIFLNHPFREYIRDQAFHRVFRIGQDTQTYIYMCELDTRGEPNISTHTAEILKWSQDQVEAIVGSSVTEKQVEGIVERLKLNPNQSLFSGATQIFKDFFNW
jgi:SNF2 family DNA or RNA helicase